MCRHSHRFQKTPIEFICICKGCGWKLHIKDVEKCGFLNKRYPETPVILTEGIWGKFKEEFYRVCEKYVLITDEHPKRRSHETTHFTEPVSQHYFTSPRCL